MQSQGMVLSEIFKGIFSKKRPFEEDHGNDVGITGLPRNIEGDFLKQREEEIKDRGNGRHLQEFWSCPSVPSFEIYIDQGNEVGGESDSLNCTHDLFQELDNMVKGMFEGFKRFNIEEFVTGFEQNEGHFHEPSEGECYEKNLNPRDKMLKNPHRDDYNFSGQFKVPMYNEDDLRKDGPNTMMDWSWTFPFANQRQMPVLNDRKDHDFDSEIESGKAKLNDILKKEEEDSVNQMPSDDRWDKGFSFGSFSSTVTRKRADGVIESQKTVKDSQGNEEVIFIRKIGDQTHKKVSMKDSAGNEEVTEDILNMDEGDLEKFEQAWSKSKVKDESIPSPFWKKNFDKENVISGGWYESIKDLFLPWKDDE